LITNYFEDLFKLVQQYRRSCTSSYFRTVGFFLL